jgi:hypothetical protein
MPICAAAGNFQKSPKMVINQSAPDRVKGAARQIDRVSVTVGRSVYWGLGF